MSDAAQENRLALAAFSVVDAANVVAGVRAGHRSRHALLEERIAEVRRWMGASLADGRAIEAAFRRVRDSMTVEEQEEFLAGFLESCGLVVRGAGRRLHDVFTDPIGNGGSSAGRTR